MAATINPYLNFKDTAKDAMDFYQSVFGGDLQRSTFADYQVSEDPAEQHKIMHSMLTTRTGQVLMAADTPNSMEYSSPKGHSLSVSGDDEQELRGYWDALSTGGTELIPLAASPWGDSFGMCVDRFGVTWMVNIAAPQQEAQGPVSPGVPVDTSGDAAGV